LPLFGRKETAESIRDVPNWEKAMSSLSERAGEEFEVATSYLPLGLFGKSEFEILRDKLRRIAVYPRSVNDKVHFGMSGFSKHSLDQLDVGFTPDGTGVQIVGTRNNFANRKLVDAFVGCMMDVYKSPWTSMHMWVRGDIYKGPLPLFAVSDALAMTVAPYLFQSKSLEPTGKYTPPQTG